ncbi:MAG: hypothetical protein J0I06_10185, partial [Planctomycetes bacterium]|nr:hypothetical protein [Planctomycetota bacterium]
MKRTATTLVLLAGLGGGGCATSDHTAHRPTQQQPQPQPAGGFGTVTRGKQADNLQGPLGEPVMMAARGAMPAGGSGVRQAGGTNTLVGTTGVIRPAGGPNPTYANVTAVVPGVGGSEIRQIGFEAPPAGGIGYGATGPYGPQQVPTR